MALRPLALTIIAVSALACVACYKGRPPGEAISAADYALRKAEEDGAAQHAPLVLHKAKEKLQRARIAQEEGANERAVRQAESAALDAQLADEMTRNARIRMIEAEAERSIAILGEELERAGAR